MFNLSETQKAEVTTKIIDFFVITFPYSLILFSFINIHYFYSQNYNIYNDIFVGLTTYITFHIYKQIYLANFREKLVTERLILLYEWERGKCSSMCLS